MTRPGAAIREAFQQASSVPLQAEAALARQKASCCSLRLGVFINCQKTQGISRLVRAEYCR
jgi:hypothetical protein